MGKRGKNVGLAMAMIALKAEGGFTASAVAAAWKKCWPDDPKPTKVKADRSSVSFEVAKALVVAGMMPGPIPKGDIEGASARSYQWPEAEKKLTGHKAHLVVTAMGKGSSALEATVLLTKAVAALLGVCKAAGVYWGNAGMVIEPREFARTARKEQRAGMNPLILWINIMPAPAARGRFSAVTMGMKALGHRELEVVDAKVDAEYGLDFLGGIANYLLDMGPVLKHGQTIGFSEDQKIKAAHTTSKFRKGVAVIRLKL